MGKFRDALVLIASKATWTLQRSEWQYKLTKISDRLQELARVTANVLMKACEMRENALQMIADNFDMDDISTEEYREMARAQKEAEDEANNWQAMQLAQTNSAEKFEQQQQQSVEVRLENANAQIESIDQALGQRSCSYFDQGAAA